MRPSREERIGTRPDRSLLYERCAACGSSAHRKSLCPHAVPVRNGRPSSRRPNPAINTKGEAFRRQMTMSNGPWAAPVDEPRAQLHGWRERVLDVTRFSIDRSTIGLRTPHPRPARVLIRARSASECVPAGHALAGAERIPARSASECVPAGHARACAERIPARSASECVPANHTLAVLRAGRKDARVALCAMLS